MRREVGAMFIKRLAYSWCSINVHSLLQERGAKAEWKGRNHQRGKPGRKDSLGERARGGNCQAYSRRS